MNESKKEKKEVGVKIKIALWCELNRPVPDRTGSTENQKSEGGKLSLG